MIRQGDIMLVPIIPYSSPPAGEPVAETVLAAGQGESGLYHQHVLVGDVIREGDVLVLTADGRLECRDRAGAVLEGRHATLLVPAGTYRLALQREYWPDAPRRVLD